MFWQCKLSKLGVKSNWWFLHVTGINSNRCFYYNIRTDNISLFLVNWLYRFSSLLFFFLYCFWCPFSVSVSMRLVACGSNWFRCSMVFSFSRWNVIEIPRAGEMACKRFIASSKFSLNDSSVFFWFVENISETWFNLGRFVAFYDLSVNKRAKQELRTTCDTSQTV